MAEQGGFDNEFVQKPPEELQSECPVCLLILCDPYQATCCGHAFCKACIDRLRLRNTTCPCCKAKEFQLFPDMRLKRSLYGHRVYCSYRSEGCEWFGEIRQLQNHLNSKPTEDEKRLDGCQYVQLPCLHCSELIQRMNLQVHESDQCPKRPYTCEFCQAFSSNYEDITTNHWSECGSYPLPCPMGCAQSIERRDFHSHVSTTCTYKMVECDFAKVGCTVMLPRKDMPGHFTENLAHHMTLLLTNQTKLQEENERLKVRCESLEEENLKWATDHTELDTKYKWLVSKQETIEQDNASAQSKCSTGQVEVTQEINALKGEIQTLRSTMAKIQSPRQQFGMPVTHAYITMNSFDGYKRYNRLWISPPFYTHPYGYKMCLGVDANGWGIGTKKMYVAVYIYLMKGEFDDELKWPLQADVTVELLNHDWGSNHAKVVSFMEMTSNGTRVYRGTRAPSGPGVTEYISHSDLQPKYLRNNALQFRIPKVEFTL